MWAGKSSPPVFQRDGGSPAPRGRRQRRLPTWGSEAEGRAGDHAAKSWLGGWPRPLSQAPPSPGQGDSTQKQGREGGCDASQLALKEAQHALCSKPEKRPHASSASLLAASPLFGGGPHPLPPSFPGPPFPPARDARTGGLMKRNGSWGAGFRKAEKSQRALWAKGPPAGREGILVCWTWDTQENAAETRRASGLRLSPRIPTSREGASALGTGRAHGGPRIRFVGQS